MDMVGRALADSKVPPQMLELELTESIAMDAPEQVIAIVRQLYDLGVRCPSTTLAPGIRRSATSSASRCTSSRSTSRLCAIWVKTPVRPTSCAPSSA